MSLQNDSSHGLNGTQAVFELPDGVTFVSSLDGSATQGGNQVVVTIGHLDAGGSAIVRIQTQVNADAGTDFTGTVQLRSSTALSVLANAVHTRVGRKAGIASAFEDTSELKNSAARDGRANSLSSRQQGR